MKQFRKLLSGVLALCMSLSLFSFAAAAAPSYAGTYNMTDILQAAGYQAGDVLNNGTFAKNSGTVQIAATKKNDASSIKVVDDGNGGLMIETVTPAGVADDGWFLQLPESYTLGTDAVITVSYDYQIVSADGICGGPYNMSLTAEPINDQAALRYMAYESKHKFEPNGPIRGLVDPRTGAEPSVVSGEWVHVVMTYDCTNATPATLSISSSSVQATETFIGVQTEVSAFYVLRQTWGGTNNAMTHNLKNLVVNVSSSSGGTTSTPTTSSTPVSVPTSEPTTSDPTSEPTTESELPDISWALNDQIATMNDGSSLERTVDGAVANKYTADYWWDGGNNSNAFIRVDGSNRYIEAQTGRDDRALPQIYFGLPQTYKDGKLTAEFEMLVEGSERITAMNMGFGLNLKYDPGQLSPNAQINGTQSALNGTAVDGAAHARNTWYRYALEADFTARTVTMTVYDENGTKLGTLTEAMANDVASNGLNMFKIRPTINNGATYDENTASYLVRNMVIGYYAPEGSETPGTSTPSTNPSDEVEWKQWVMNDQIANVNGRLSAPTPGGFGAYWGDMDIIAGTDGPTVRGTSEFTLLLGGVYEHGTLEAEFDMLVEVGSNFTTLGSWTDFGFFTDEMIPGQLSKTTPPGSIGDAEHRIDWAAVEGRQLTHVMGEWYHYVLSVDLSYQTTTLTYSNSDGSITGSMTKPFNTANNCVDYQDDGHVSRVNQFRFIPYVAMDRTGGYQLKNVVVTYQAPDKTPTPLAPVDGEFMVTTKQPTFKWSDAAANSYTLELSTTPDFSADVRKISNLTKNTYQWAGTLQDLTDYYWRVTSYFGDGSSYVSTTATFQTDMPARADRTYDLSEYIDIFGLVEGEWWDQGGEVTLPIARRNAQIIQSFLDFAGQNGGGTIILPEGTYCLASDYTVYSQRCLYIKYDNLTLIGAGKNADGSYKSVLRANGRWDAGPDVAAEDKIFRSGGITIVGEPWVAEDGTPRQNIRLEGFELDGGRGWGHEVSWDPVNERELGWYNWDYIPETDNDWDVGHQGITVSQNNLVSHVYLNDLYVHSFSGETLYVGGDSVGYLEVINCTIADTNASCFNLNAAWLNVQNNQFGTPDGKCRFWIEYSPRPCMLTYEVPEIPEYFEYGRDTAYFAGNSFYNAVGANGIAIAQGNCNSDPYTVIFENNYFDNILTGEREENGKGVGENGIFQIAGGAYGPTILRNNTFENIVNGPILNFAYGGVVKDEDGNENYSWSKNKNIWVENNVGTNLSGPIIDMWQNWNPNTQPLENVYIRNNTFSGMDTTVKSIAIGNHGGTVATAADLTNVVVSGNTFANCLEPEEISEFLGNAPFFTNNTYTDTASPVQELSASNTLLKPLYEKLVANASTAVTASMRTGRNEDGQIVTIIGAEGTANITFAPNGTGYNVDQTYVVAAGDQLNLQYDAANAVWNFVSYNEDAPVASEPTAPSAPVTSRPTTTTWKLNDQIDGLPVGTQLTTPGAAEYGAKLGNADTMTIQSGNVVRGEMAWASDSDKPQFVFQLPETYTSGVLTAKFDMMIENGTSIWWMDFGFGKSGNDPLYTTPQGMIGDNEHRVDWATVVPYEGRTHTQGTWYHYVLKVDLDAKTSTLTVYDAAGVEKAALTKAFNTANNGVDVDNKGQSGIVDQFIIMPHNNGENAGAYQVKNVEISAPGSYDPTTSEPTSSQPTSSQPTSSTPTSSQPTTSTPTGDTTSWKLNDQIDGLPVGTQMTTPGAAQYGAALGNADTMTIMSGNVVRGEMGWASDSDKPQFIFQLPETFTSGVLTAELDMMIETGTSIWWMDFGFGKSGNDPRYTTPQGMIGDNEHRIDWATVAPYEGRLHTQGVWYHYVITVDLDAKTTTLMVYDANGALKSSLTKAFNTENDGVTVNASKGQTGIVDQFIIMPHNNGENAGAYQVKNVVITVPGSHDSTTSEPTSSEPTSSEPTTSTPAGDTTSWKLNDQIDGLPVGTQMTTPGAAQYGAALGNADTMTIMSGNVVRGEMAWASDSDKPQFIFQLPETFTSGVLTAELDMMIETGTSIWWMDFGFGKSGNDPRYTTPQGMIGDNEHRVDWRTVDPYEGRLHTQGVWYHYVITVDLDAKTTTLMVYDANGALKSSLTKAFNTENDGVTVNANKGQTGIVDQFIIMPHNNGENAGAYQVKNVVITVPGTYEPTTSEPTSSEPTSSEPTSSEPTSSDPTSSEPVSSEPTVEAYSVSGEVTSFESTRDADRTVTIRLIDKDGNVVALVTSTDGTYTIEDVVDGDYILEVSAVNHVTREYEVTVDGEDVTLDAAIWLIGDVNGDGRITVVDANLLYSYYCGIGELDDYAVLCGDLNGNGSITVMEVNAIYAHVREASSLWE